MSSGEHGADLDPEQWPGSAALPELSRWPAVSVIIPARNCETTLEAAVTSALGQRFDGSIEVVIAVAPSDDGTERLAGELSHTHLKVRYQPNLDGSTPAGLNAAIRAARGDVLVRLDAHAEMPPGYIEKGIEVLRETRAGNVGGMQVPVGERPFGRAVAAAMASPLGSGGARYRIGGPPGDVETVYLGIYRKEALEEVGGFDESLARNQDYELNHRLREAGYRVYFHPDLQVRYRPRTTPRTLWRQYADYGAWKRHVAIRHPDSLRPRQLLPPLLVLGLAAAAVASIVLATIWPFLLLAGFYVLGLLAGGAVAVAGRGDGLSLAPLVAFALGSMHVAWGLGFLVGRRRGGRPVVD